MSVYAILDRDGTIIENRHYLSDPDDIVLLPGAAEGLSLMQDLGIGIIVITNQSGIARGYFTAERLETIHERLILLLKKQGIAVKGIYICPHHPNDNCRCRKPNTGLLSRASADFNFNPETAFVIGDNHCDIELGKRAGANTILVRTGYGTTVEREAKITPDFIEDNLLRAATAIEQVIRRESGRMV